MKRYLFTSLGGFKASLDCANNCDYPDAWPYRDVKVGLLTCEAQQVQ